MKHLEIEKSDDAGLYLCEFTYYISMDRREAPVIFIHVPPVGQPYSQENIDAILGYLVGLIIDDCADESRRKRMP